MFYKWIVYWLYCKFKDNFLIVNLVKIIISLVIMGYYFNLGFFLMILFIG